MEQGETSDRPVPLRELKEELGVAAAGVRLIGPLSQLYVYGTNSLAIPCGSAWPGNPRPEIRPCAAEVDEVLEVSLTQFADESQSSGRYHRQLAGI